MKDTRTASLNEVYSILDWSLAASGVLEVSKIAKLSVLIDRSNIYCDAAHFTMLSVCLIAVWFPG